MGSQGCDYTKYQAINKKSQRYPHMKPKMTGGSSGEDRSAGSSFEYEHFPVVCPTCQGLGEICDDGRCSFITKDILL